MSQHTLHLKRLYTTVFKPTDPTKSEHYQDDCGSKSFLLEGRNPEWIWVLNSGWVASSYTPEQTVPSPDVLCFCQKCLYKKNPGIFIWNWRIQIHLWQRRVTNTPIVLYIIYYIVPFLFWSCLAFFFSQSACLKKYNFVWSGLCWVFAWSGLLRQEVQHFSLKSPTLLNKTARLHPDRYSFPAWSVDLLHNSLLPVHPNHHQKITVAPLKANLPILIFPLGRHSL